ncbi:MAG: ABC transporter permease [Bacteroidales bacterium]|nr:ABC transporter permease [Bacteroidales bacterium]
MPFRSWLSRFALILLIIVFLLSFFSYLFIPDRSSYANLQVVEIAFKPPGYSCYFLYIPTSSLKHSSWLKRFWSGHEITYEVLPFESYQVRGDSLFLFPGTIPYPKSDSVITVNMKHLYETGKKLGWISSRESYSVDLVKNVFIKKKKFLLGTDKLGRDYLSRLIVGGRMSLIAGFLGMLISIVVGFLIGILAGFWGGWLDKILVWFFTVIWSLPTILLVMAISFALGKGYWQVLIAIGLTMWVDVARAVRGQVMSVKERLHITAARALGIPSWRIMFFHILPEVRSVLMVLAANSFNTAILIESGVSFLGLGIQPPVPSWGNLVRDYYSHLVLPTAYLALFPGLLIAIVIFCLMVIANELRDYYDVRNV